MNEPYVKKYNKEGFLLNEITAANPFVNATPYSSRGKSASYKRTNNRKQTRGRKLVKLPMTKLVGYTVTAAQIDEEGKKTKNSFTQFIEVVIPRYKYDRKKSNRQNKKIRFAGVDEAIDNAKERAMKVRDKQKFTCNIIAKFEKSDIVIHQN